MKSKIGPLDFYNDSLRKPSFFYLLSLLLCMLISSVIYMTTKGAVGISLKIQVLFYYFVIFIHLVYRFKKSGSLIFLTPDILIIVLYTLFHLGYINFYILGLVPYSEKVFFYDSSITKAVFVVVLGLIAFLFGYECVLRVKIASNYGFREVPTQMWEFCGIIIMLFAILMHFAGLFFLGLDNILAYGYAAIQNAERYIPYWQNICLSKSTHMMTFGLLVYLIGSVLRYGVLFRSKIALALLVFFSCIVILEGDRGPLLKFFIPPILFYHYLIKRIKIRNLLLFLILILFLFGVMSAVRSMALRPTKMLEEFKHKRESQTIEWYSPFVEMGSSFMVVNITTNDVPRYEPYWRGASWRDSIFHIIPFLQGFLLEKGVSKWAPSNWITYTYFGREAAGRGFTVVAEGYLNFGYIGVFLELFMYGFFIRWLTVKFATKRNATWAMIMFGCIGVSVFLVRGHLNNVTNVCAQIFVIAFILKLILKNERINMA